MLTVTLVIWGPVELFRPFEPPTFRPCRLTVKAQLLIRNIYARRREISVLSVCYSMIFLFSMLKLVF